MMKTKTQIDELWGLSSLHLQASPLSEDSLHLRRMEVKGAHLFYVGFDSDGRPLFAVGSKARPPRFEICSSAFDYYVSERADKSWLMILRLEDRSLSNVFSTLCGDLSDELIEIKDEKSVWSVIKERLVSWQKLFEITSKGVLQPNQIRGLFSELLTLKGLIEQAPYDLRTIVSSWNGPHGSNQDFQLPNLNIEVKTIGQDANSVRISSLDQLNSDKRLLLYVFCIQQSSESDALSVNQLVMELESMLSSNLDALRRFRAILMTIGFLLDKCYDEQKYILNMRSIYEISERFPALTRLTVPIGIKSAEYTVSLESIKPFMVADTNYGNA